jgi:hypothetical protein
MKTTNLKEICKSCSTTFKDLWKTVINIYNKLQHAHLYKIPTYLQQHSEDLKHFSSSHSDARYIYSLHSQQWTVSFFQWKKLSIKVCIYIFIICNMLCPWKPNKCKELHLSLPRISCAKIINKSLNLLTSACLIEMALVHYMRHCLSTR